MGLSHIPLVIRPPVGRMPVRTRWYLAVMLALLMILLGLHFSAQISSQDQAEQWLSRWVHQANQQPDSELRVGQVRFRMLRGALSLHDVQWRHGRQQASIPYLLLQGDLLRATSLQQPSSLSSIAMRNVNVTLLTPSFAYGKDEAVLLPELLPQWRQAWLLARQVDLDISTMTLLREQTDKTADTAALRTHQLKLHHVRIRRTGHDDSHQWFVTAKSGPASEAGELQMDIGSQAGHIQWKGLAADPWLSFLGRSGTGGILSGSADWSLGKVWGETVLTQTITDLPALMRWQGELDSSQPLEVQLKAWPLDTLGEAGTDGWFLGGTADVAWKVSTVEEGWQATADQARVSQLHVQWPQEHFEVKEMNVELEQLSMNWPERTLSVQQARVLSASIVSESTIWPVTGTLSDIRGWSVQVKHMDARHMQLNLSERGLEVHDIEATGDWSHNRFGHHFTLQAQTSLTEDSQGEIPETGVWSVKISVSGVDQHRQVHAALQATDVPVRFFRTDLPESIATQSSLQGEVDLQFSADWLRQDDSGEYGPVENRPISGTPMWLIQGDVQGRDLVWERSGWQWRLDELELQQLQRVSGGLAEVDRLDVQGWQVVAPMVLLDAMMADGYSEPAQMLPQPWLQGWHIGQTSLQEGSFALGQEDKRWIDAMSLTIKQPEALKPASLNFQGLLGEGHLSVYGQWNPIDSVEPLSLDARIDDALPFVLNDWMKLSRLPAWMQGRLSARLSVEPSYDGAQVFNGQMSVELADAQLAMTAAESEAFIQQAGTSPQSVLSRLERNGKVLLKDSFVSVTPLEWPMIGQTLFNAMKSELPATSEKLIRESHVVGRMRIHQFEPNQRVAGYVEGFSLNERMRLRKMIRQIKQDKSVWIELVPQLGDHELDDGFLRQIREEQQRIEAFMRKRGVAAGQIIPVWPQVKHHSREAAGIRIEGVSYCKAKSS